MQTPIAIPIMGTVLVMILLARRANVIMAIFSAPQGNVKVPIVFVPIELV
jgi:hypothetical protein